MALILAAGIYLIIRFGKKGYGFNLFVNRTALILIFFAVIQLLNEQSFQTSTQINHDLSGLQDKTVLDPARVINKNNLPDVYLIVLDNYAQDDVLQRAFNYDNKPFLQKLTDLEFIIPKYTMTNYAYTVLAMSSELNMNYINAFYPNIDPQATGINDTIFTDYIRHSLVRKNFSDLGYKTISFESDTRWVELPNADIFHTTETPGQLFYKFLDTTECARF